MTTESDDEFLDMPKLGLMDCVRTKRLYDMARNSKKFEDVHAALVLAEIWDSFLVTVLEYEAIARFFGEAQDLLHSMKDWDAIYPTRGSDNVLLAVNHGGVIQFARCRATGAETGVAEFDNDAERILVDNMFEDEVMNSSRLEAIARWMLAESLPCEIRNAKPKSDIEAGMSFPLSIQTNAK